jgi:hypothetical protein
LQDFTLISIGDLAGFDSAELDFELDPQEIEKIELISKMELSFRICFIFAILNNNKERILIVKL